MQATLEWVDFVQENPERVDFAESSFVQEFPELANSAEVDSVQVYPERVSFAEVSLEPAGSVQELPEQ